jgi:hypothetical protein
MMVRYWGNKIVKKAKSSVVWNYLAIPTYQARLPILNESANKIIKFLFGNPENPDRSGP